MDSASLEFNELNLSELLQFRDNDLLHTKSFALKLAANFLLIFAK